MAISASVGRCLSLFASLIDDIVGLHDATKSKICDELGRFRVWCGNVSAHRTGRRSLEYRLRDSSNLEATVLSLLVELSSALGGAKNTLLGTARDSDEDSDDFFELEDEDLSDVDPIAQSIEGIKDVVDCLMRFSMALRNPARHDQIRSSDTTSVQHFAGPYADHLRTKFPNIPTYLEDRLVRAMLRHRQYINYREKHHQKLAEGLGEVGGQEDDKPTTMATSVERDPGLLPQVRTLDSGSISGYSETSYAETSSEPVKLQPPSLPESGHAGNPFECHMCFNIIVVDGERSWQQHVFEDLPPYVCVLEDCVTADHPYARRRDWQRHVQSSHQKVYNCPLGCSGPTMSVTTVKTHMKTQHQMENSDHGTLERFVEISARNTNIKTSAIEACPLCGLELHLSMYFKHVGHHQEQLALFTLPRHLISSASEHGSDVGELVDGLAFEEEEDQGGASATGDGSVQDYSENEDRARRDAAEKEAEKDAVEEANITEESDATKAAMRYEGAQSVQQRAEVQQKAAEKINAAVRKEIEKKIEGEAKKAKDEHDKKLAEAKKAQEEAEKKAKDAEAEAAKRKPPDDALQLPINFKDAVGRKFSFPWHICRSWKGIESLIKQAFVHVDLIGDYVHQGHYDLLGPNGEVILPQLWERTVKPGWDISMHMWPEQEKKKKMALEIGVPAEAYGDPLAMFGDLSMVDVQHKKSKRDKKDSRDPKIKAKSSGKPINPFAWIVGGNVKPTKKHGGEAALIEQVTREIDHPMASSESMTVPPISQPTVPTIGVVDNEAESSIQQPDAGEKARRGSLYYEDMRRQREEAYKVEVREPERRERRQGSEYYD